MRQRDATKSFLSYTQGVYYSSLGGGLFRSLVYFGQAPGHEPPQKWEKYPKPFSSNVPNVPDEWKEQKQEEEEEKKRAIGGKEK